MNQPWTDQAGIMSGQVEVVTTSGRGHTPEEIAEMCVDKIISVSDKTHPLISDQAHDFKEDILACITYYMKKAIASDRTTVTNALNDAGQPELAKMIRRL